jgi:hypothetical protein
MALAAADQDIQAEGNMANSRKPGPSNFPFGPVRVSARTCGPLGYNDHGDPNITALLGDTPGPLGYNDYGDPNLPMLSRFERVGRLMDGTAVSAGQHASASRDFIWNGRFDWDRAREAYSKYFRTVAHYDAASIPNLKALIGFVENDSNVNDIRWMAYMLATAYWETSHIESVDTTTRNKKGRLVTRKKKHWVNMNPVEETGHGAGRSYFAPVKVKLLPTGEATVTEQDGDQFAVRTNGTYSALTKGAKMGSTAGAAASKAYEDAEGTEHSYFGRGYVQLTWWSNYAKASVYLDMGLNLLSDPEKVMDPSTAYAIMSYGMRTGKGFANGHKLSDFFSADKRNYVGARKMVNGTDHNSEIAKLAILFEDVLYEARDLR